MDIGSAITWLLTVGAKAIGVSANVLLSLIGTGALTEFLNIVLGIFGSGNLEGNALLMAWIGFFVACAKFIPTAAGAVPSNWKYVGAKESPVVDAMRIF